MFDAGGFNAGLGLVDAGFDLEGGINAPGQSWVIWSGVHLNHSVLVIPVQFGGGKAYRIVDHPLDRHQYPQAAGHGELARKE